MDLRPLVGKQRDSVRLATAPGNLWVGAVRSSKTVCSLLRWLQYLRNGPAGPVAMIGRTERTLKRNVLDPIVDMVGSSRFKVMSGAGEAEFLGRKIYLAGADNETAVAKIQGMTLAGFYGDEIPVWAEDVFKMATTRLSIPDAQWFGTGNPASATHWLKTGVINRAMTEIDLNGNVIHRYGDDAVEVRVFHFQLKDNPTLDADFVRRLEREYTGIFYQRFILGKWVMAEGAVYPMWDENLHVIPNHKVPFITRWIGTGTDVGHTNPFHSVLLGLGADPRNDSEKALFITHEWRHDPRATMRDMTALEYVQAYRKWLVEAEIPGVQEPGRLPLCGIEPEQHFVDPAAKGYRIQLFRDGINSWPADNAVLDGISTGATLLKSRKLYVAERCTELRAEFPDYAWDDKAAAKGEDKVLKVRDHGLDAGRYAWETSAQSWHHDVYGWAMQ